MQNLPNQQEQPPKPQLEKLTIHAWLINQQIKNERGEPIDFYNHPFLFQIYSDFNPDLVCYKAAQVGFTTMAILKSLWAVKNKRLDAIYTMPTQSDAYSLLVKGKVNRLIDSNSVLRDYVKSADSIEQKQIDKNIIYYRGTFTEQEALAVTSDWNIHDEEDRSDQLVIAQYASRLQHSRYKWNHHFSNPSVEGNGVSRYWADSDQKHWFITCPTCKADQFLMWPESIDQINGAYVCKYCKATLTDDDRRNGRWVAKFKNKRFSGYWISLLMAPWVPATEIIRYYETKSKEYFWNFVLGLPYVGEGNKVTPDIIYRNLTAVINRQENVVIGCDSGIVKHFVLGNAQGLFYHGKTESWSDIARYLDLYPNSIAVIDAMPDITGPRQLQEKYPGRVFLVHYAKDRKTQQIIRWGKNEEYGNVLADRNRLLELVINEFGLSRIPLQGTRDDWSTYYEHWDTLYRVKTEDRVTHTEAFEWLSSNGNDHWCHATAYYRIGMDKGAMGGAEILGDTPRIEAPAGPEISPRETIHPVTPTGKDPVQATLEELKNQDYGDWRDA